MNDAFLNFLSKVCENPGLEIEWVDLLSQLEYVGCRKILKGVDFGRVNLEILRHVHEESLHAYLLKAVVDRARPNRGWEEGLFTRAGWNYFRRLDERVSASDENKSLAYPGVSWAIERRVLEVYPRYLELTRNPDVKRALERILAQEKRHGDLFEETPFPESYRAKAAAIEGALWEEFLSETTRLIT